MEKLLKGIMKTKKVNPLKKELLGIKYTKEDKIKDNRFILIVAMIVFVIYLILF